MKIDDKITKYIKEYSMLDIGDRVLVGVSGGADSVCLLHYLATHSKQLGIVVFASHINHGLRTEADDEQEYVTKLCNKLGVTIFFEKFDIEKIAKEKNIGTEAAGRNARYSFFTKICDENSINKIATAHHMNDNAETILMHLFRGSGIKGLSGISPMSQNIIRPLLCITRSQTEQYCKQNNISFCIDNSNYDEKYTRNRVRLHTIPDIEKNYNPSFVSTITNSARYISDDSEYLDSIAKEAYLSVKADNMLSLTKLRAHHPSICRRIIMYHISDVCKTTSDIYSSYIDQIYTLIQGGNTGKAVTLPNGYIANVEYDNLSVIKKTEENDYCYKLELDKSVFIPELNANVTLVLADTPKGECFEYSSDSNIIIRNRRAGDSFCPVGMTGTKKLKNYYIDSKLTRSQRALQPLLVIDDRIALVIGMRKDRRFIPQKKYAKIVIETL